MVGVELLVVELGSAKERCLHIHKRLNRGMNLWPYHLYLLGTRMQDLPYPVQGYCFANDSQSQSGSQKADWNGSSYQHLQKTVSNHHMFLQSHHWCHLDCLFHYLNPMQGFSLQGYRFVTVRSHRLHGHLDP